MDAFCNRRNAGRNSFRFLFQDHEVKDHDTAESLGMKFFDIINVIELDN